MTLHERDVRLLRLSVAVCLGLWDDLRALRRAAPPGEPDRGWREALLQAHLFAGFPRTVEACGVLAQAGGLGPEEPGEAEEPGAGGDRRAEGRAVFARVYGEQTAPVRARLESQSPTLLAWVESHAYGRVLSRGGLDLATRELLAVACLAAQEQERQLASHVRGAVRAGACPSAVEEALLAVADLVGDSRLRSALRVAAAFGGDAD